MSEAREVARSLLEEALPRRWAHSQGVARKAEALGRILTPDEHVLVQSAAWLHDIGYAPPLVDTGFHPLDGARYLRDRGFGDRALWTLVANHTGAAAEAAERGLASELATEFPVADVPSHLMDCVAYCDLTSGPDGAPTLVEDRIAEILRRYPAEHVVHRTINGSKGRLIDIVRAVETRLDAPIKG